MKKLDLSNLHPAVRSLGSGGLDPSLMRLAILAALPFLACVVIVLHDPAVKFKLLLSFAIVGVVSLLIAGALCYVFAAREGRSDKG
jgi:hypothetical protein